MKKILFVTGSRSEYGLLKNLINLFAKEKNYECHLLITGNHFSKRYGSSKDRIKKIQGIKIHLIDFKIKDSKIINIVETMSLSLRKFSQLFSKLKLDQIIVVGDRFESYTASVAAKLNNIKIAHFHGGETTTGAYDNYWRHSISLMSDLHFVANNQYKIRVSQIIDSKKNIHCIGGLGVDNIKGIKFKDKDKLANEFSFSFNRHNIVIVFHSETNHALTNTSNFKTLIKACKKIKSDRLIDCCLYVTLEPCIMCAAAISRSKIKKLYFGADDLKYGAINGNINFFQSKNCNYVPEIYDSILKSECEKMINDFFKGNR